MTRDGESPLHESDLIFPSASSSLKLTLGELKKSNLSLKNRFRSIRQDSEFVGQVADACLLPLIANERCGSWYIVPARKAGSVYFKSTDGHFGQWAFSLRRLNFQVLDVMHEDGGCIIVDSTRRGKSMPDALSKTIPIWITVLNRLLFPENLEAGELRTPPDVVSESEHAQIEARLDQCLDQVRGLGLDLVSLRRKLNGKPMQVCWQRPPLSPHRPHADGDVNLVILCTASKQMSNETSATSDYVQGAADDAESWAFGLDAATFWKHEEELRAASEDELPLLISTHMQRVRQGMATRAPILVQPTSHLWVGTNEMAASVGDQFDIIISCTTPADAAARGEKVNAGRYITLTCSPGKNGSRQLRTQICRLGAVPALLHATCKILVSCESGKDLSIGVALALLCTSCDDTGAWLARGVEATASTKMMIRKRLSWIMLSIPDANPSRATLQSVNAYLMG